MQDPDGSGVRGDVSREERYCLVEGLSALDQQYGPGLPPPWAPGRREEAPHVDHAAATADTKTWCMSEVDIFQDLSPDEMDAIAAAAPMRSYATGEMLYSPHNAVETLFILKTGRVRIFRISEDGRAFTTAIITPGTIFGEMVLLGQRMYDNYAEALEDSVVCVMSSADVRQHLLSDPRISGRITEILGARLIDMERRLSDTVFKNVSQRVASALVTLSGRQDCYGVGPKAGPPIVNLTHEQIAALAGTSRETATKILGDFAHRGLIKLGRGRVAIIDANKIDIEAGG